MVYKRLLQQQSHCNHSDMSWRTFAWHCLIQGLPCSILYNTNWTLGLEHLDKQVPLLANCNRYPGTYISISSELHALLFEVACTNCIVFFCSLLRFSSVFTHRSCLLAHPNAVTVLSVWTLSHWLWPSSMLSQGIPLFFSPRHGISWLLTRSRVWPNVSTNTNVRPATKHRSPALTN